MPKRAVRDHCNMVPFTPGNHSVLDGALGAAYLSAFKALIENPLMMVV